MTEICITRRNSALTQYGVRTVALNYNTPHHLIGVQVFAQWRWGKQSDTSIHWQLNYDLLNLLQHTQGKDTAA